MEYILRNDKIIFKYRNNERVYKIIKDPIPHILIDSNKEMHGWYDSKDKEGRRACTAERLLLNPYNGCGWNCIFCYANNLWGYFKLFHEEKIITVFKDYDKVIKKHLSNLKVASCGYLSPITDPFQPLNNKYKLTEKIIETFLLFGLPVEVTTKGKISNNAIRLLSKQEYNHSFGQVSIITLNEYLKKELILNSGASTEILFDNIRKLADNNIHAVCRIDPIIPFLTDNIREIDTIIQRAVSEGAKHIGISCLDIPIFIKNYILKKMEEIESGLEDKINNLYNEKISVDLHADIHYRKDLFLKIKKICDKLGVTMATCMEFERIPNDPIYYKNLNDEFMTSRNCEGIDIPLYKRNSYHGRFYPINSCFGNCLTCNSSPIPCNIPDLKLAKNWKLKDYRKWSKSTIIPKKTLENYIQTN